MLLISYTRMVSDGTFLSKEICISEPKNPAGYLIQPCLMLETISTIGRKGLFGLFKFFARVIVWTFYLPILKMRHQISFYNEGLKTSKKYKYDSFPNHLKRFGDEGKKIFLKIDIDGGEYEAVNDEKFHQALDNVVQMAIEFHNADTRFAEIKSIVETINKKFTIVHFHGNNYRGVFEVAGKQVPMAFELTFLNNAYIKDKQPDFSPMPIPEMDYPNQPKQPDINISRIFT